MTMKWKYTIKMCALLVVMTGSSAVTLRAATQETVLGAGCFWCVEAVYERVPGVLDVISGYAGGTFPDPTYAQVSRGKTDQVEVVKIVYDSDQVSYSELLEIFWKTHDPTDGRGVWPDFGPHYRSILLPVDQKQLEQAQAAKEAQSEKLDKPVATEIRRLDRFYPAEDYHQDYVLKNPRDRYVQRIALPKLEKVFGTPLPDRAL